MTEPEPHAKVAARARGYAALTIDDGSELCDLIQVPAEVMVIKWHVA